MSKNNFIKILFISVLLGLSLSCQEAEFKEISNNVNEPFDTVQEEYVVFKALLREKRKGYVVLDEPPDEAFGIRIEFFEKEFPDIQSDTLTNYVERNKVPLKIHPPPFDFDYSVVNKKDFEKKLEKEFQYYEFSRVGFSNDGKQAFVHFSDVCKALCGKGAYYLLKKEGGNWKVVKESVAWVS